MEYPILETYHAVYRDAHGVEAAAIENDGEQLSLKVRGVTFVGKTLTDFEPASILVPDTMASFTLNHGENFSELCGCGIEFDIPTQIVVAGTVAAASLHLWLRLGSPAERGWLDEQTLIAELTLGEQTYRSSGTSGWFEDELLDLQRLLPPGTLLRMCIACAFSDYSVYGHGFFGNLLCFRDNKAKYLAVKTKNDYLKVPFTEQVQETYHCPYWQQRVPGTGYCG